MGSAGARGTGARREEGDLGVKNADEHEREAANALHQRPSSANASALFIQHAQACSLLAISQRLGELNDYLRAGSRGERS